MSLASRFVNRTSELTALTAWAGRPGPSMAVVWGRKRVGKTWLVDRFAEGRRSFRHTCRPGSHLLELEAISKKAAQVISLPRRSLTESPFESWRDAFNVFVAASADEPLVVVLDELPELLRPVPTFDKELRALWDEVVADGARGLKLVLCGSAVSTMEAVQAENAPLYGRFDLRLLVQPFRPHEAALMLKDLEPSARAEAWGVCGGIPRFLSLWDTSVPFRDNIGQLVANEHGLLLSEGDLILGDEEVVGHRAQHLPEQVLRSIAAGNTSFAAIRSKVSGLPTRTLDYLCDLRLIERVNPVTEDPARTKLSYYRIADNFLAFCLSCAEPHREAIEAGRGRTVLNVIVKEFSDFMGPRYEQAFRQHLRRMASEGRFGDDVVDVGEWWRLQAGPTKDPCQLDGLVLSGRKRAPIAVGEAKWALKTNGSSLLGEMRRKLLSSRLADADAVGYVVAARGEVTRARGVIAVTAADIFS